MLWDSYRRVFSRLWCFEILLYYGTVIYRCVTRRTSVACTPPVRRSMRAVSSLCFKAVHFLTRAILSLRCITASNFVP